jgi:hypothetical protein
MTDNAQREIAFVQSFEGRFPSGDPSAAGRLIEEGRSVSSNAAFCVLNEICRAPFPAVGKARQRELVGDWSAGFEHPLKAPILRCAAALIEERSLPYEFCSATAKLIAQHPGEYAALNFAYYAVGADDEASDAAVWLETQAIRKAWEASPAEQSPRSAKLG